MAYRSDLQAAEARKAALEAKLAEVRTSRRAAERDLPVLRGEEARLAADLAESRCAVLRMRPELEDLRVASPCPASWDAMTGDDRVRFCGQCAKNVYNLSAMTREEAERLVFERERGTCVRFYRRADGTVLTSDCDFRAVRGRRWKVAIVAGAVVAIAVGLAMQMCRAEQGDLSVGAIPSTPSGETGR